MSEDYSKLAIEEIQRRLGMIATAPEEQKLAPILLSKVARFMSDEIGIFKEALTDSIIKLKDSNEIIAKGNTRLARTNIVLTLIIVICTIVSVVNNLIGT